MMNRTNPLRLPPYTGATPAVVTVTCVCSQRYVVISGEADACGEQVRRQAEARGAIVVDARRQPFMNCACGSPLDFSTDVSGELM